MLHYLEVGKGTSDSMISAAVTQCVQQVSSFLFVCHLNLSQLNITKTSNMPDLTGSLLK